MSVRWLTQPRTYPVQRVQIELISPVGDDEFHRVAVRQGLRFLRAELPNILATRSDELG